jgi:hypothetical protein
MLEDAVNQCPIKIKKQGGQIGTAAIASFLLSSVHHGA